MIDEIEKEQRAYRNSELIQIPPIRKKIAIKIPGRRLLQCVLFSNKRGIKSSNIICACYEKSYIDFVQKNTAVKQHILLFSFILSFTRSKKTFIYLYNV